MMIFLFHPNHALLKQIPVGGLWEGCGRVAQHQSLAFDGMLKRCCSIWIRTCLVQKFPVEFELD